MQKEKVPLVSHVSDNGVESGSIGLRITKNKENVVPCAFIRLKKLKLSFEEIINRENLGFNDDDHFGDKWWILFGGDKGGI